MWGISTVEMKIIYMFRKHLGQFKTLGLVLQGRCGGPHWEPDYPNVW